MTASGFPIFQVPCSSQMIRRSALVAASSSGSVMVLFKGSAVVMIPSKVFSGSVHLLISSPDRASATDKVLGGFCSAGVLAIRLINAAESGASGGLNWKPAKSSMVLRIPSPPPAWAMTASAWVVVRPNKPANRERAWTSKKAEQILRAIAACVGGRSSAYASKKSRTRALGSPPKDARWEGGATMSAVNGERFVV